MKREGKGGCIRLTSSNVFTASLMCSSRVVAVSSARDRTVVPAWRGHAGKSDSIICHVAYRDISETLPRRRAWQRGVLSQLLTLLSCQPTVSLLVPKVLEFGPIRAQHFR
jgi:hypothetical protein